MDKRVGDFELDVWTGGAPIWVHIRHNGQEFKFRSEDLPDLAYIVECARRASSANGGERG